MSNFSAAISRSIPGSAKIGFGDIHIWRFELSKLRPVLEDLERELTVAERQRADRFAFQKDREMFVSVRGTLRFVLANYLGEHPRRIKIVYGEYGRPYLAASSSMLSFNVSHSGERALIAVSKGSRVGIDVETLNIHIDVQMMISALSKGERHQLAGIEHCKLIQAFFKCWTSKEAYVKGLGLGLSAPLRDFDVCVDPDKPAQLLTPLYHDADRWSLHLLNEGQGHIAVVATTCHVPRLYILDGWEMVV